MALHQNNRLTTTILKAEYAAPNAAKVFTHSLPNSDATSTEEKIAYLSALRKSVVQLQDEVNTFLTTKMGEDKTGVLVDGIKVDDRKEEENYGEETIEEDE